MAAQRVDPVGKRFDHWLGDYHATAPLASFLAGTIQLTFGEAVGFGGFCSENNPTLD